MNSDRVEHLENILDDLYEQWRELRRETIEQLRNREALKIIDFHANNWIDIVKWISSKYKREEQMNIVIFQFSRLFKEIYWLQFLFHTGNYPTAYRNLRYILEMICQAYSIDTKYPTLTLDDQIEKAMEIEERVFGWNVISSALCKVFNKTDKETRARFKPLWDDLNKYAHPSARQIDLVVEEDFSALVTDSFNESLARELLIVTDKVFDIVYAVVLKRFPRAISLAQQYRFLGEWQECLPN
ncbi:unnamed protein product, partial [marine sediment metagenome]